MRGGCETVVSGALRWLAAREDASALTTVALAPDQGERYLDSVYDPSWVERHFGSPMSWDEAADRDLRSRELARDV
ncbi:hypothetical protein ACF08M_12150 [Streptomyces sp. NPDC015032]|uniref:hypothetical protein n=1 Tax=Streptomyces sp. NPDC015032 TaxID=3364937 RepID=UPI0036FC05B6